MSLAPRPAYLVTGETNLGQRLAGGLQAPRPNRISLKDDRFTLITESGMPHPAVPPSLSLQVIFVGGNPHASRVYYDSDSYDPDNPDGPVCWSDNGVGPSDKSSQPQSSTCAQCPKAVWGSATSKMTGKGVPACSSRKKVAVLVAGAGSDVFLLDIPSASLKAFGGYMARLGGELHASPEEVVTAITMVNKELQFKEAAWLPQEMLQPVAAIVASEAPDLVVGALDRPVQARLAAPPQAPVQQLAPAPVREAPVQYAEQAPDQGFGLMYPKAAQVVDERNPPPPEPMTSHQAEAFHSGQVVEPPKTRKPRTPRQETVVGPGPIPAATFAQPTPTSGFIQQPAAAQAQNAPQFGMQSAPAAPPADLNAMLADAFKLPIAGR